MLKTTFLTAISILTLGGASIAAFANVVTAGGGVWSYGFTGSFNSTAYSSYTHGLRWHSATVANYSGTVNTSQAGAGQTAKATVGVGNFGNAAFYYNYF